jgi:diacylglycerol kinase family enzyme
MPRIEVIVNASSGSFVEGETDKAIAGAFARSGPDAKVTLARGGEEVVELAQGSDADILGAAGGDGTISAVAAVAIERDKPLAVVPLGTLNHFAKDIGLPADLNEVAQVIAAGNVDTVDVGQVNDRVFINNSSIGLYPHIVHRREKQQERLGRGKWRAAFSAAIEVFRRHAFFRVRMEIDGVTRVHKVPFVFVGNNEYVMDLYNVGSRATLKDGKLSVYYLRRGGRWGVIRLLVRTLFGMLDSMKEFEQLTAESLTIEMRKENVLVAFDGEVEVMQTPLEYRIRPRALKVIVPAEAAE